MLMAALRRALGTDGIPELRTMMASAAEQLDALNNRFSDLIADVRANNEILQTKAGQLDEEGQAALDRLSANIAAFDAEVGDKDGSEQDPAAGDENAPPQ